MPCPPPGNLPDPGIEPMSLMSPASAGGFFTTSATWEAPKMLLSQYKTSFRKKYFNCDEKFILHNNFTIGEFVVRYNEEGIITLIPKRKYVTLKVLGHTAVVG